MGRRKRRGRGEGKRRNREREKREGERRERNGGGKGRDRENGGKGRKQRGTGRKRKKGQERGGTTLGLGLHTLPSSSIHDCGISAGLVKGQVTVNSTGAIHAFESVPSAAHFISRPTTLLLKTNLSVGLIQILPSLGLK